MRKALICAALAVLGLWVIPATPAVAVPSECKGNQTYIAGTSGPDNWNTNFGYPVCIEAKGGNDHIELNGNYVDTILGGPGNDYIDTGDGADWIYGGTGEDDIFGKAGADFIFGEGDGDTIDGNGGDDYIEGMGSKDWVYGDDGCDIMGLDPDTEGGNDHYEGNGCSTDILIYCWGYPPHVDASSSWEIDVSWEAWVDDNGACPTQM